MNLTFIYQVFILFSLHSCILSFSECNSNNRKTVLSLKRSKYQPQTKKRSLTKKVLNKTSSLITPFTTCFTISKFILVYYVLAYKSEPRQGIHVSSLTEYKFNVLEFLEFQNKLKNYLNIFHYQIYTVPKMKIKNHD